MCENSINVQVFEGQYDDEGVYVYQAYCHEIADWAIEHQKFGGPGFNPRRMTWIKPSFAWVLYRSGYGRKHNQERVLKIKLSHETIGAILEECECKHGGGGSLGRVQWDPARDLYTVENGEPRKFLGKRAIQIGMKGRLSEQYVMSTISIEDVTDLAHLVGEAHAAAESKRYYSRSGETEGFASPLEALTEYLPLEREYIPQCSDAALERLGMVPGITADQVAGLGRGKVGLRHK